MSRFDRHIAGWALVFSGLALWSAGGIAVRADEPVPGNPAAAKGKTATKPAQAATANGDQGETPELIESVWESRVRAALKRESSTKGAAQDEAVRELVALYEQLRSAKGMDKDERAALRGLVRNRLARSGERIAKRIEKAKKSPAVTANQILASAGSAADQPYVAAGNAGAGGRGGAQGPRDHGQELVELIQHTIAPSTWDVNGGNGTIIYFAPRQALVVRQTDDVHGDLGAVLEGLRDAGR